MLKKKIQRCPKVAEQLVCGYAYLKLRISSAITDSPSAPPSERASERAMPNSRKLGAKWLPGLLP